MADRKISGGDLSAGGEWLYRQGELILGPLQAYQLVEKLYSGELNGQTEVSPVSEHRFRAIAQTEFFAVHLAKAEAKLRVEATARAEQTKARRKRNAIIGAVAAVAIVVAVGAAFLARYLAVHNPFRSADDLADVITISPPQVTVARAHRRDDEELLEYAGAKKPNGASGGGAVAARSTPSQRPGGTLGQADDDGLQTGNFDQEGINSVVAQHQRKLFTCFKEEKDRDPKFAARIPMEFVIGNDGRVSRLWVDNPSYARGPLADCLLRELQKWPFKAYEGEQATVGLSFTIGIKS